MICIINSHCCDYYCLIYKLKGLIYLVNCLSGKSNSLTRVVVIKRSVLVANHSVNEQPSRDQITEMGDLYSHGRIVRHQSFTSGC